METIRARTRIWAAGVQASPLARCSPSRRASETDRAGRIPVNPDCTLPGHPEVFAIGDMVSLNKLPGRRPAGDAGGQVRRQGDQGAAGGRAGAEPFKYFDKGTMATIGYRSAVADAFGIKFTGVLAYLDVGVHPHALPDRLGQPARHALHLGARDWCSPRTAATGSSPTVVQQGPPYGTHPIDRSACGELRTGRAGRTTWRARLAVPAVQASPTVPARRRVRGRDGRGSVQVFVDLRPVRCHRDARGAA